MALKGTESKEIIGKQILKMFPGSFIYEKEIRIPMEENGETVQIKCTLTCAKTNVNIGEDTQIPGENSYSTNTCAEPLTARGNTELSAEEKDNIKRLAEMLNL